MGKVCLKVMFGAVSAVCSILSLGLAVVGVWYILKLKEVTDLRNYDEFRSDAITWTEILPYVFATIGSLGMLITCCGLCGSLVSSKSCLITYNVCAVIIIISMIASGVITIMLGTESTEQNLKTIFNSAFDESKEKLDVRNRFNELESENRCCGVFKPNDYPKMNYPKSCCDQGTECKNVQNKRPGCLSVFVSRTNNVFLGETIGCGIVAFFAFVSIILSIIIVRKLNTKSLTTFR